jgi:exopolysaccharide production protein ExoQ
MRSLRVFVESLIVAALLFFFSEAVRYVILNPGGEGSTVLRDDPFRAPTQMGIYFLTALLFLQNWRLTLRSMREAWLFWALLALVIASPAWSVDRSLSARTAVWLTATSLLGLYFDLRFPVRRQLQFLGFVFAIVIVLSIDFVAFVPKLGLEPSIHAGAWRGAFVHRNSLGRAMALATLVYALLLLTARRSLAFVIVLIACAITLAIRSQSATAPLLIASLVLLVPLRGIIRIKGFSLPAAIIASCLVVASVGWLAIANIDFLLHLVGRDSTLSGRPLLWFSLLSVVQRKLLLGYGLLGFWKGSAGDAAPIEALVGWKPGQAHNGFIDLALDIGVLGLGLFLAGFGVAIWRALVRIRDSQDTVESAWPLAYLTFFFLTNMTETSTLRPNTLFWFLYAATISRLMRSQVENATASNHPVLPRANYGSMVQSVHSPAAR